jgi:hypothetical protein
VNERGVLKPQTNPNERLLMNKKMEFATTMQVRTKAFAVQIVKFFSSLPKVDEACVLQTSLNTAKRNAGR